MAKDSYRVGVVGMVHDHVWGLAKSFANCPNAEIVAAADPNEPLRERMGSEFGVSALYTDWQKMLEKEELDVALITTENSGAADVVEAAAPKGIHLVVEKPMAATFGQADRMLKAAEAAGVQLMVNWATAWRPNTRKAIELANSGAIGQVFSVRVRMAHHGPKELGCSEYFYGWLHDAEKNGAGAFMDYCCYGAAFCRYLLGQPNAVMGAADRLVKDYIDVDDNGLVVMFYDKAYAVTEASWCQIPDYHDTVSSAAKARSSPTAASYSWPRSPGRSRRRSNCPSCRPAGRAAPSTSSTASIPVRPWRECAAPG